MAGVDIDDEMISGARAKAPELGWHQLDLSTFDLGETFDAVVMAKAALDRLGEHPPVVDVLSCEAMVPQVGQGALAVECRADDGRVCSVLAPIQDPVARREVDAERAFLTTLGGDCTLPAGAHAHVRGDTLAMRAVLADGPDGRCHTVVGEDEDGEALGRSLARQLLDTVAW